MVNRLDFDWCYGVLGSRDNRFDGWFYTAVTSTGIYCRPSCPARTPLRHNVQFYPSAAAAQQAGFRACRRCRPDAVPGSPQWDVRVDVVARAIRLIADGVVDREGVAGLASRLGYTTRHLRRMLIAELGAGPLALARAQRAQTARVLLETTDLGTAQVAYAAGFGSVRQFNDTVRQVYGVPPSVLRAAGGGAHNRVPGTVVLRLAYRQPFDGAAMLDFLGSRALPGVEERDGGSYRRMLLLPGGPATVELRPASGYVRARLQLTDLRDLAPAVTRCRRLLDLDADPAAIDAALAADPAMAADVTAAPGVRVPRAVDGFEIAARAVVGQQVSVAGARTVLGRLSSRAHGEAAGQAPGLRPFPSPEQLLALPDEAFPMPARRRRTLRTVAEAVAEGSLDLSPGGDRAEVAAKLRAISGIGDWTVGYIAMRALGEPDAFLPTDLGVRRGAAALGLPVAPKPLAAHAHRWSPWRSYALIRLWRHA